MQLRKFIVLILIIFLCSKSAAQIDSLNEQSKFLTQEIQLLTSALYLKWYMSYFTPVTDTTIKPLTDSVVSFYNRLHKFGNQLKTRKYNDPWVAAMLPDLTAEMDSVFTRYAAIYNEYKANTGIDAISALIGCADNPVQCLISIVTRFAIKQ